MALLDSNNPQDWKRMISLWASDSVYSHKIGYRTIVHAIREGEHETLCGDWYNPRDQKDIMTDPNHITCHGCRKIVIEETTGLSAK